MRKPMIAMFIPFAVFSLGCLTEVNGERATSGCPEGEVCNPQTPNGLSFTGQMFYDEGGVERLGPLLVGGTFDVSFRSLDGELGVYEVDSDDPSVMTVRKGEGAQVLELDVYEGAEVRGVSEGIANLRVVDGRNRLYDRLAMQVYEIDDVELHNVSEPTRPELIAGCDEMLGVHLLVEDSGTPLRAFDSSVTVRVNDEALVAENGAWDCFVYRPPEEEREVTVVVKAGNRSFEIVYDVRERYPDEACPELPLD